LGVALVFGAEGVFLPLALVVRVGTTSSTSSSSSSSSSSLEEGGGVGSFLAFALERVYLLPGGGSSGIGSLSSSLFSAT